MYVGGDARKDTAKRKERLSRVRGQVATLIDYIDREASPDLVIVENVWSPPARRSKLKDEFAKNVLLTQPRSNGNVLFHDWLSFGRGDKEKLTNIMLEDLGRQWIALRAPTAKWYGRVHRGTDCTHLHFIFTANGCDARAKIRMRPNEFVTAKKKLELYQRKRYPQLTDSLAIAKGEERKLLQQGRGGLKETPKEERRRQRLKDQGKPYTPTQKELAAQSILGSMEKAASPEAFLLRLKLLGYSLYQRGKNVGVMRLETGKKYRFRTLGLDRQYRERAERWFLLPEFEAQIRSARAWDGSSPGIAVQILGSRKAAREALEPLQSRPLTIYQQQEVSRFLEALQAFDPEHSRRKRLPRRKRPGESDESSAR